jgi:predicted NBD/HSP70 family sugar kinase/transcriptional regulator with XRE-family HTH domain
MPDEENSMVKKAVRVQPPNKSVPGDDEMDELRAEVEQDPAARAVYEDTMLRTVLLAAGPALRRQERISQKDVAVAMATTQSAVSDLESGRVEPHLRTLQRYARALGRRLDFALVDEALPASPDGTSDALFGQLSEQALSPLFTTLLTQEDESARTLDSLARSVLLPKRLIGPILSMLQAAGWTKSDGKGDHRIYSLVDEAAYVIGVSLRRDRIVGVLIAINGDVRTETSVTPADSTSQTVITRTIDVIESLYRAAAGHRVLGVGVGLAGVIDAESGRVDFAPDLQSSADPWRGVELERDLQKLARERLENEDILVAVENDANALALREYLRRGDHSVIVVLLSGVGIGAGLVFGGKLAPGAHSAAGEGGHTIVDAAGPKCIAGLAHQGCLETMTSAYGILRGLGIPCETSLQVSQGLAAVNDRVSTGDSATIASLFEAGRALGRFLATTILLIDPARAVFYAHRELASSHDYAAAHQFQRGVQTSLEEASGSRLFVLEPPRLEWQPLEEQTGAIAAAAAATGHFLRRPSRWAPSLTASSRATNTALVGV